MITGSMMMEIVYDPKMSDADREQLREKAEQGDVDAQYRWGGELYEADDKECAEWWKKAAKQGHVSALCDFGALHMLGMHVRRDVKYGVDLLRRAAEQGCGCALYNLAYCSREGLGMKKSKAAYVQYLRRSAKQGYALALYDLAWCYGAGVGVKADMDERMRLLLQSAEMGCLAAMAEYSFECLEPDDESRENLAEGLKWTHKAAEIGDCEAMSELARIYAKGLYGVPQDKAAAHYWVRRAATSSMLDPEEAVREFEEEMRWEYIEENWEY